MSTVRTYWRLVVVTLKFLPIFFSYYRDRRKYVLFGGSREVSEDMQRSRAERLRSSMLSLGPTFIKLGQVLSTRPDVLPPAYTEEFASLQDDVPPAEWNAVKRVLEDELDGDVSELYDSFETEAISGASLGQVYTAVLDGDDVAVKVRRPGIEPKIKSDIQVLEWLTPIVMQFVGEGRAFSIETLSDEFTTTIMEELDYAREKDELEQVRENFSDDSQIRIPEPIDTHSSSRVLTMEYVDGTKIDDLDALDSLGLNKTELSEKLQKTYYRMIFEHGLFHADPHPGNLAVEDDGTIIFYDFGMTGRITEETRERLTDFYAAVATDNIDAALDAMIDMGILDPEAERDLMYDVISLALQNARGETVEQRKVEDIVGRIESELYNFPFRLPQNFSMLLRVATIANGVCLTLNPQFDFIDVATEYLKENGYLQESVKKIATGQVEQVQQTLNSVARTPKKLEEALDTINNEQLEAQVELQNEIRLRRVGLHVGLAILASGLVVSGSIVYALAEQMASIPLFAGAILCIVLFLYGAL